MSEADDFIARHYPDVAQFGGTPALLRHHLAALGSSVEVTGFAGKEGGTWAWAKGKGRLSQVCTALKLRLFLCDFWENGVALAKVESDSPLLIASLLDAWFAQGVSASKLKALFDVVELQECALAYEAGPRAYVEFSWRKLERWLREDDSMKPLLPLVELVRAHPRLGNLMPFTSMGRLGLSVSTGYPFTVVGLAHESRASPGLFIVETYDGPEIFQGDGRAVLSYWDAQLPPDCSGAVHGTAEDVPPRTE